MELFKVIVLLCAVNQPAADCDRHTAIIKMYGLPHNCAREAFVMAKRYIRPGQHVRRISCKPHRK